MGAIFKFVIPAVLLAASVLVFQNCGNTFHGNGDPYEIGDNSTIDDGRLDIDPVNGGGDSGGASNGQSQHQDLPPPPPGFVSELVCSPSSTTSVLASLQFGTLSGADKALLKTRTGVIKYVDWDSEETSFNAFTTMSSTVQVQTINLNASAKSASVVLSDKGVLKTETFTCK